MDAQYTETCEAPDLIIEHDGKQIRLKKPTNISVENAAHAYARAHDHYASRLRPYQHGTPTYELVKHLPKEPGIILPGEKFLRKAWYSAVEKAMLYGGDIGVADLEHELVQGIRLRAALMPTPPGEPADVTIRDRTGTFRYRIPYGHTAEDVATAFAEINDWFKHSPSNYPVLTEGDPENPPVVYTITNSIPDPPPPAFPINDVERSRRLVAWRAELSLAWLRKGREGGLAVLKEWEERDARKRRT